jgi:hypothetical protein
MFTYTGVQGFLQNPAPYTTFLSNEGICIEDQIRHKEVKNDARHTFIPNKKERNDAQKRRSETQKREKNNPQKQRARNDAQTTQITTRVKIRDLIAYKFHNLL